MSMLRNVLAAVALSGTAVLGLSTAVVSAVSAAEQGGQKFTPNVAKALKAAQDATKKGQWNVAMDQIKQAQAPEIDTMTSWLKIWDEPIEPHGGMEGHDISSMDGMDGMMSEDQMAELEAAEGEEAARVFLASMTEHHNGAVAMAQEEIDNGKNAEAVALAATIVETQQAEIQEMEELLAVL